MTKKVSIYDPSVDAYREVSLEEAKKFVEVAKQVEQDIARIEKDESTP